MGEVALVLAGGGAKGAYEAGVLQAFAEHEVIPQHLVGISAGALNGAYAANLIASGTFTPQNIRNVLSDLWYERASLVNLYDAPAPPDQEAGSLQRLLSRIGIDPLRKVAWVRLGLDPLLALRDLTSGRFMSILSHGLAKGHLEEYLVPPTEVVRPVSFAVAVTNILGTTCLAEQGLCERHCVYERFTWDEDHAPEDREAQFAWMREVLLASCSVPFVFPPTRLHLTGEEKPGLYADGGLIASAPIDQAIAMSPDVDTIYVVMAATVVGEPSREPNSFLQILSRVFSIIAGRFVIQNYRDVLAVNERILALREVLDHDRRGAVARNRRNELMVQAAGFRSLDDFLTKRVIRLVPIAPEVPLKGGIFSAFSHPELRRQYIDQGYADACRALTSRTAANVVRADLPARV